MTPSDSLFERIVLLKGVPFFQLLRTDQLRQLATLLEPVAWVEGDQVFEHGELGDAMFVVVSGLIGISTSTPPDCNTLVARMGPGDCFGEMALLDDRPRSATACVLTNTEAYSLNKERLRGLLLSYPEMGLGMLRAMSGRLREANLALIEARTA